MPLLPSNPGKILAFLCLALPVSFAHASDFSAGKVVYAKNCQACHQPTGAGIKGAFPPLANNPNLKDNAEHVARVILKGQSGPITVNGDTYNGMMPPMAHISDEDIAQVVAFILHEWNQSTSKLSASDIKAMR